MPTKTDPEVRHYDLSDCRGRVSPYFKAGDWVGNLMVIDCIERRRQSEPYRIRVVCTSCKGEPYWCRVDHLRYGRCQRCTGCQRKRLVLQTHGERPPEPETATDEKGRTYDLVGMQKPTHQLHWLYNRCLRARNRCESQQDNLYAAYGGRGIQFQFESPAAMVEYLITLPRFRTARKKRLSIDRIDNDLHYAEGNLRWSDSKTQSNNRRTTRYVAVNENLTVKRSEAVDYIHGISACSKSALNSDFDKGYSFDVTYLRGLFRGYDVFCRLFGTPDVRALEFIIGESGEISAICCGTKLYSINSSESSALGS